MQGRIKTKTESERTIVYTALNWRHQITSAKDPMEPWWESICGFTQNMVVSHKLWSLLIVFLYFVLSSCYHSDSHLQWEKAVGVLGIWGSGFSYKNMCACIHTAVGLHERNQTKILHKIWGMDRGDEKRSSSMQSGDVCCRIHLCLQRAVSKKEMSCMVTYI